MKTIRINMDRWFDKQDERWRALPIESQHKYALYLFAGYLLLTVGVLLKVYYDMARSDNRMLIEHIDNPVPKNESPSFLKDTLSTISKKEIYERK